MRLRHTSVPVRAGASTQRRQAIAGGATSPSGSRRSSLPRPNNRTDRRLRPALRVRRCRRRPPFDLPRAVRDVSRSATRSQSRHHRSCLPARHATRLAARSPIPRRPRLRQLLAGAHPRLRPDQDRRARSPVPRLATRQRRRIRHRHCRTPTYRRRRHPRRSPLPNRPTRAHEGVAAAALTTTTRVTCQRTAEQRPIVAHRTPAPRRAGWCSSIQTTASPVWLIATPTFRSSRRYSLRVRGMPTLSRARRLRSPTLIATAVDKATLTDRPDRWR
jgi:hypothetical protein